MPRFWPMFRKEFIQMRRDRLTLGMMIGIPVLQLLLFGYAIQTDVRNIPTVVVDESRTPQSRDLIAAFRAQCREDRVPPFLPHPRWGDRRGTTLTHPSARISQPWPTVANWTSPPDDASAPASPESSSSCPYWLAWASTRSSTRPAIPALRWCRPPAPC